MNEKIQLTRIQKKFIDIILQVIELDDELILFTQSRATGKTFALLQLDKILNSRVKKDSFFIDNPHLTDNYKKIINGRKT